MKRIVFVCPYDVSRPGGVRTHIFDLARTLGEKGHDVCVIGSSSNSVEKSGVPLLTLGRAIKMPLWGTNIDITRLSAAEIRQLRQYFHRFKPDVIHFHTPWTPFLSWQILRLVHKMRKRARNFDGKLSGQSQGHESSDLQSHLAYQDPSFDPGDTTSGPNNSLDRHETKFIATFHDSPPDSFWGKILGSFIMPAVAKYFLNAFDEVISVSNHQSQFISKWSEKRIHIIPNGILIKGSNSVNSKGKLSLADVELNQSQESNKSQAESEQSLNDSNSSAVQIMNPTSNSKMYANPKASVSHGESTSMDKTIQPDLIPGSSTICPNILFLGRLEPRKGVMHMLEAYLKVLESIPQAQLTIAGDGPDRKEAETFVRIHQLEGVRFLGMVSDEEKAQVFSNASVFVSPALYGESFGIVLLEAMTYGIPIAGYGNPGYLSVVGEVCPENFPSPGDTRSLAHRIIHILQNDEYRDSLVSRYSDQLKKYDWNTLADKILDVYNTES
jgi:glycosyltransferase involved in cell wall biosynthesis